MSITRSITQSTLSTTGDTIYMDAESRTSDFATPESSIHRAEDQQQLEVQETGEVVTIGGDETAHDAGEPGGSSDSTATDMEDKEENRDKADSEVKAVVLKEDGAEEEAANTDQPTPAARPTYVRQRGHESSGSECHEFFCQNNCFEVLDMPSPSGWWGLLCGTCCASCYSGGVSGGAKAIK